MVGRLGRVVASVSLLALGAAFAARSEQASRDLLPAPTGRYSVGTRLLPPEIDRSRADKRFTRGYRTLQVQLWYPASPSHEPYASYFMEAPLLDTLKGESSAPEALERLRSLHTDALLTAPLAGGRYPLFLFSPGFGMPRAVYTSWVEQLASDGFIVAVIDHPFVGEMWIDGRALRAVPHPAGPQAQTAEMVADLHFLLPGLRSLPGVDPLRIAAIGHSIGGAAAIEACRFESALSACINLDGDPSFGHFSEVDVGKPFLVIHQKPVIPGAKPDGNLAKMGREIESAWKTVIAKQSRPVTRLAVRGTVHLSFTDLPFVRPSLTPASEGAATDPLRVLRATTAVMENYLNHSFAGYPGASLDLPDFISSAHLGEPD